MSHALTQAFALHQSGQLASAADLYRAVLTDDPNNADALHLLGVVHHQQGDHSRATELIGRAVVVRPSIPGFHVNLAEAYRALGQLERAAGCCRTALRLWPDYPEAHGNLGLALLGLRRHQEAITHFHRALELRPDTAVVHSNLAIALRELNQLDEALTHFRRAVELDPHSPSARSNLGQILLDRGEAAEALPHCREAIRLQPDLAPLHHNLGAALRALGEFIDARAAYLEAIRLDSNLARSHAHLGQVLHQEGQLGDAVVWLKQAVELEPGNAVFWSSLAEVHAEREEHGEAIACWQRGLALEPEQAVAHNGLAWSLQEEGQLAEAGEHYRTALRLQPDFPAVYLNLGGLHEELGELAEAETAVRTALRLQPDFVLPHARLATLLGGKLPDADLAALEERLTDTQLTDEVRASLLFGQAMVLDARREFARAAEALRQANALMRTWGQRRQRDYVPAEHERFVDGLLHVFNQEFFDRVSGLGLATRRPVFVFGLPRSGTSLIEQVLASHSRVHGAGELRLARQSFESIPATLGRSALPMDCVPQLDGATLQRLAEQHEGRLRALAGSTAERVVDKMPDNYMYLGLLAALFPQAQFIHCRRDLRDVAVSCWMTNFRSIRWANEPMHITSRFGQYRRLMEHWRTVLPVPMVEVDYEETVSDLEGVARRLLTACGLEWEPACLEFHRTRRPVRTASVTQVRQPVYTQSVARWKNYERELAELFDALPVSEEVPSRSENRTRVRRASEGTVSGTGMSSWCRLTTSVA
jgi:tetratricopeptide (TPR) repeat protein